MTRRTRLQRSQADSEQFGNLVVSLCSPLCLINHHHTRWFCRGGMICLVLNGCHQLTVVKEMGNESVWFLVSVTSKLEILTYLYSGPVSSAGQRLRWRSTRQANKYNYRRANKWLKWRERHCSIPSTAEVCKTTTTNFAAQKYTKLFSCQPTLRGFVK